MKLQRSLTNAGAVILSVLIAITTLSFPHANESLAADGRTPSREVPDDLPEVVSFNAHIRPIMSNTCFTCHGPDDEQNFSGFRIDSFESATGPLPSDEALVGIKPGAPDLSEVYLRIIGEGEGEQMPPGDFRHQLSDRDKGLFRKWIEQGAVYESHWAWSPLVSPSLPASSESNPVDAFVSERLKPSGLTLSPEAERATLLRRLSLDLTGLPPTPAEIRAFENDRSPDAYEKQVDRLLASPHFGERMAAFWLDLVRFADTVGYHGDQNQRIFPYRDYVINAFNSNKPFDEFTREQLAGDLLPDPTPEQLAATGFLRLNMMTREGGAQPGEYLAKYKADRVRSIGTAWLGATLGCCECHNHKYDPFTARDFYSMGAFFDDLRQWGVYSDYGYTPNPDLRGFTNDHPFPPELRIDSPSLRAEIIALQKERDDLLAEAISDSKPDMPAFREWLANLQTFLDDNPDGWKSLSPESVQTTGNTTHEVLEDGSILFSGEPSETSESMEIAIRIDEPILVSSIRLEVLPDARHDWHVGRGKEGDFSLSFAAAIHHDPEGKNEPVIVPNQPRFIRVELEGEQKILTLAEVEVMGRDAAGNLTNIASKGRASQSSTHGNYKASLAIDGNTNGDTKQVQSISHTSTESSPWWELDLGAATSIESIAIWNRSEGLESRLDGFRILLLDGDRRRLKEFRPETPRPSVELAIDATAELSPLQALNVAWGEADRRQTNRYNNGLPPRMLESVWRSGPARWQLPVDENRLLHTAIHHLAKPVWFTPDKALTVTINSSDVGRIRLSVTTVGHAIAGWDAAGPEIGDALRVYRVGNSRPPATLISAWHRSTVPVDEQHPIARKYRDRILDCHGGLAMTLVAQGTGEGTFPVSRVLPRGNWQDQSGEVVVPGVPHFLPQPEVDEGTRLNRMDLADWITSPDNPLTPRHFANRTWKQFFGTGLSARMDDLGNQGEWPSHPQLLDWLACDFRDNGWDTKRLVRTLVTSRTYRQQSAVRGDLDKIDPYNRLLSQQTPRRLEAEIVRDNALAIAGLLETSYAGGPSVFPYQPDGHYSNLQFPNRGYQASDDFRQYRRGVYMHWQRTFLHPMLVNFDAPSRDECAADRNLSNSPQQALTLLNDPVFVEASIAMADRVLKETEQDDFAARAETAMRLALGRSPDPSEAESLRRVYVTQRQYYETNREEAQRMLKTGLYGTRTVEAENPVERAAWSQVCRVVLNLHETITRY